MKIELNPHFKPDESVLYCGSAVYATLQSREEPLPVEGYVRLWKVRTLRRGTHKRFYAKIKNRRGTLVPSVTEATIFPSYKEAEMVAQRLMESGTMLEAEIIEVLRFDFEDDYNAT